MRTDTVARSEWRLFGDVVFALLLRELKTRYGNYRMGYAWALLEPLITISLFCYVFGMKQQHSLFGNVEPAVFIVAGFLPFLLFRNCIKRLESAVSSNQNLFCFRQIQPFDALFTRFMLECLISILTLIVLIVGMLWLRFNALPTYPLLLLAGISLLALMGFGIGMLFCIIGTLFNEADKFLPILMRPLVWISCVYHPLSMVPYDYRHFFLWNPVVHAMELIRKSWIANYPDCGASWTYLASCALICLSLSLSAYRLYHNRLVTTS